MRQPSKNYQLQTSSVFLKVFKMKEERGMTKDDYYEIKQ